MKQTPVRVKWNGDIVKAGFEEVAERAIFNFGKRVADLAKQKAPKRYGPLAASINVQTKNYGTSVEEQTKYRAMNPPLNRTRFPYSNLSKPSSVKTAVIGTNIFYATSVEFGTKPHPIVAFRARILAAKWGPNNFEVFGEYVNHPGQSSEPFMRPAFYEMANRGIKVMTEEARNAIQFSRIAKYIDF